MTKLLSTTFLAASLTDIPEALFEKGHHPGEMLESGISDADAIVEWAARTCYNSNSKFGTNPHFVRKLIDVGHLDVLEHAVATFEFETYLPEELFNIQSQNRYLLMFEDVFQDNERLIISGNMRSFLELLWNKKSLSAFARLVGANAITELISYLFALAPNIFYAYENLATRDVNEEIWRLRDEHNATRILQTHAPRVTMLGYANRIVTNAVETAFLPYHATFHIKQVSRAFTHQHVRHRLLSHSQLSFRYVDMSDAHFIAPEDFSFQEMKIFNEHNELTVARYKLLRATAKKEDARSILPASTETEIISSAYFAGWKHYIKLRAAKDAQLEIRKVAFMILDMHIQLMAEEIINEQG